MVLVVQDRREVEIVVAIGPGFSYALGRVEMQEIIGIGRVRRNATLASSSQRRLLSEIFYTVNTVEPVVLRASRSRWAWAASWSGYVWLMLIFTEPLRTTPNNSCAPASRSSRLAA